MKEINSNLSAELIIRISSYLSKMETIHKIKKDVLFFQLNDLNSDSRLQLRKAIQKNNDTYVVILSNKIEVALFAWKINAIYFLQLPFSNGSLSKLAQKLTEVSTSQINPKIKILTKDGFEIIDLSDISFIKGQGDYCTLYIRGRKPLLVAKRIMKFKETLVQFNGYEIITKSLIININHISKIVAKEASFVTLPHLRLKLSDSSVAIIKRKLFWID